MKTMKFTEVKSLPKVIQLVRGGPGLPIQINPSNADMQIFLIYSCSVKKMDYIFCFLLFTSLPINIPVVQAQGN